MTASGIIFIQDVAGGYRYVKTLSLVAGKPQLRIEHVLTNTSTAPLISNVYDHNFVRLSPGNGDVTATFPFALTPDIMPNPALMRVSGHSFSFVHPLKGDERAAFLISGFGTSPSDYDVDVKDTKTGAGVRVTGDDRLVRLYTWSIRTVMAVEPFVGIDLKPGEVKREPWLLPGERARVVTKRVDQVRCREHDGAQVGDGGVPGEPGHPRP